MRQFRFGAITNTDCRDSARQVCDRPLALTKEDLHWLHVLSCSCIVDITVV